MSKTNRNYSKLSFQIFIRYGAIILGAIAIIGVSFYIIFYNILLDENVESSKASVIGSGKYIESYIDKIYSLSKLTANDEKVKDYIENGDEYLKSDILNDIDTMIGTDKFIESVIIVTHDGRIISNDNSITMEMSSDMMKKSWYVQAMHSMPHLTPTRMNEFTQNKDSWVISISTEITDDNSKNLGILLIDIDYKFVYDHLLNMQLKESSEVFIMNSCEELVYHKDTSYFTDQEKIKALNLCMLAEESYDKSANTLTYKYEIENTDWALVIVTELTNLVELRNSVVIAMVIITVAIGALVLLLSVIFSRRVTRPIKDLQDTMSKENHTHMQLSEKNNYCIEVKNLTQSYNSMIDRINMLIALNSQKERKLHEREIEALTNQINPHFLYNTLDTILWMAETKDSVGVVLMTKALAQFFRLSLNGGSSMISVKNEIDHALQYLKIQSIRYGEKLSYSFDVDETINDCVVPKIILQPIIENAIYHGIKEADRNGNISISAKRKGEYICFVITDDGVGFDTSIQKSANKTRLSGVGIANVDERLRLHYGDEAGVSIQSEAGKGTTVILTAKCEQPRE